MKKLISLAAILLLCVCLFAVSASADSASASFTGPDTVRAGDTITLTFSLNGSGIFGASGKLSYDSSQLTLVETQQVIGNDWAVEWNGNNFIAYDDSNNMDQPINDNAALFTVKFRVNENLTTLSIVRASVVNVKSSDGDVDTNIGTVSYSKTIIPPIFEYTVIDGDACITGYNGDGGLVTIPGVIDGYSVTQIGEYAFEECTNITGIVIPDSVVSIGSSAFSGCSNLEMVIYPGTKAQWNTIHIGSGNDSLTDTTVRCLKCYVTFNNADGSLLTEKLYNYGDAVEIPQIPPKAADETYTYTAGWDKEVTTVTEDVVYTVTYTPTYINYTIIFKGADGAVLSEKTYHYGDTVAAPQIPVKEADETYTYTGKWDKAVVNCAGNATYTATYTPVYIDYTVIFKNWNGTVLSTKTYHYGDVITAPTNPTKASDNMYTYVFNGWDQDVVNCAGSVTYTATYKATYKEYIIEFKNWNGVVISVETYHWGDTVTVPSNPAKAADNIYTYTFAGWDKEVVNCAGDATYEATYTPVYIEYTVIFQNWNGSIISSKTYHWGEAISVPADPTRPNDSGYSYTFKGWDKAVVNCAGNAIYTATYTAKALVPSAITSSKYTVSSGMISKIELNTTVSALISNLNEGQYAKVYTGTQEVTGSTLVGTGMVVKIMDGTTVKASATIVVTGDINGDGKTNITDMLAAKAHVLKKTPLEGAAAMAGDINANGQITVTDFLQLKAHVLKKSQIQPKSAVVVAAASMVSQTSVPAIRTQQEVPAARTLSFVQNDAVVPDRKSVIAL